MAKVTIEIAGQNNEQYIWPVTQTALRGRWSASKVAKHDKSTALKALSEIEHIPGLQVWIDTRAKTCGIYDPLGVNEKGEPVSDVGQRIWRHIERVQQQNSTVFTKTAPWEPVVQTDLTNDQLKEWTYWMARAVEGRHAIYADGSQQLPPISDIVKLPGRIKNEPFNSGTKGHDIPVFQFEVADAGAKSPT